MNDLALGDPAETASSSGGTGSTTTVATQADGTSNVDATAAMSTTEGASSSTSDDASSSGTSSSTTGGERVCESTSPYRGLGECDPYAHDCPPGEKCTAGLGEGTNAINTTYCVALDPDPDGLGESCTGTYGPPSDSCDVGLLCVTDFGGSGVGRCYDFCDCGPLDPVCAEGTTCSVWGDPMPVCASHCDPFGDGDDCYPEESCLHAALGLAQPVEPFLCVPLPTGVHPPGDACLLGDNLQCVSGTLCVAQELVPDCGPSLDGCCAALCDETGDGSECSSVPGSQCVSMYPEGGAPEPYLENVGYCGL